MTKDPVEPPLVPDGHVHHRLNAVHVEIGLAQLASAGIAPRLMRRDDAVFGDGGKIARVVARPQYVAGGVSTLGANEVVLTYDRASVRKQLPDVRPLGVDADCGRLSDGAARLGP